VLLPGATVLARAVARARDRAAARLHRTLAEAVTAEQRHRLEELLEVPVNEQLSRLQELRAGPRTLTASEVAEAFERLAAVAAGEVAEAFERLAAVRAVGVHRRCARRPAGGHWPVTAWPPRPRRCGA